MHTSNPVAPMPSFVSDAISLSTRRRRLLFAMVAIAGLLNVVDRQIIAILKPVIAADLGWTDDDYGTLAAVFQGASACAFLLTGWIVDRVGPKWSNAGGVTAWSIAACAHGLVRSTAGFIGVRVALGATEAMGTPAMTKAVAVLLPPEQRGAAFGTLNAVGSIGAIITPLAVPALAGIVGWQQTFIVAGSAGLVWTILWLLATRGFTLAVPAPTQLVEPAPVREGLLSSRRTWAIILAKIFSDAPWWFVSFWMADFMHRRFGLSGVALGVPLAIAFGSGAIGSVCAGWWSNYLVRKGMRPDLARRRCLGVTALLILPAPLVLVAPDLVTVTAVFALIVAGHQAFSSNLFALIADVTPQGVLGRTTSLGAFSGNLGGMIVLKATGLLLMSGFGYAPMMIFVGLSYSAAWLSLRIVLGRAG